MKAYWWTTTYHNFGDELTPIVLKHFLGKEPKLAHRRDSGKFLGIGSIMASIRQGDIVWGTGSNQPGRKYDARGCTILAVRGPLTDSQIKGAAHNTHIYGDPAILLPLIYNPTVKKTGKVGIIPHYVDKKCAVEKHQGEDVKMIDILGDWKKVIREILSCEKIISSSLHGIIAAEAYGIPAVWTKYDTSSKIRGGDYKFQDYFLGTGRTEQKPNRVIPPIPNLALRQGRLLGVLESLK